MGTDEFNAQLIPAAKGNARRLSKLMRGVVRTAQINGREIDGDLINHFAKMLIN